MNNKPELIVVTPVVIRRAVEDALGFSQSLAGDSADAIDIMMASSKRDKTVKQVLDEVMEAVMEAAVVSPVSKREYEKVLTELNEERKLRANLIARVDRLLNLVDEMDRELRQLNDAWNYTHAEKRGAFRFLLNRWHNKFFSNPSDMPASSVPDSEIPF